MFGKLPQPHPTRLFTLTNTHPHVGNLISIQKQDEVWRISPDINPLHLRPFKRCLKARSFLIPKEMPEKTIIELLKAFKYPGENRMFPQIILDPHMEVSQALYIATRLTEGMVLLLNNTNISQEMAWILAESLNHGVIIKCVPGIKEDILVGIAQRLAIGASLSCDHNTSPFVAKKVASTLRLGASILLGNLINNDFSPKSNPVLCEAIASNLPAGSILKMLPSESLTNCSSVIKHLKKAVFFISKRKVS